MLKSRVRFVAHCEPHEGGSCAIDEDLLNAAGIAESERVHVSNLSNGQRFVTNAIKAPRGRGAITLNGSAAHGATVGDVVIIAAFSQVSEDKARGFIPTLVFAHETHREAAPFRGYPTAV